MAISFDTKTFQAAIDAWVRKTEKRVELIFKESTQRVVSKMQSRIPVDTGFARSSIRASLQQMPEIDPNFRGDPGKRYSSGGDVSVVIAQASLGDTIYIGYTASYVGFLENGHSQQAPSGFVRISAMEFPQIVKEVTAEAKQRVQNS